MKNLKRNQIIILVIALMLVSAGYLNYTSNTVQTSNNDDYTQYAGIGDAKLVNSNVINEENIDNSNNEEQVEIDEIIENNSIETKEKTENTNATLESKQSDEYFSTSKLNRETMYSQMIESYQKILENESISADQKTIAQTEIKNINDMKNKIMICENLIKTKGIEDLIIFVNDKSISVVVKATELAQEKIAQIQNIVTREMQAEISDIHISNK